jgi:hypothetical protein
MPNQRQTRGTDLDGNQNQVPRIELSQIQDQDRNQTESQELNPNPAGDIDRSDEGDEDSDFEFESCENVPARPEPTPDEEVVEDAQVEFQENVTSIANVTSSTSSQKQNFFLVVSIYSDVECNYTALLLNAREAGYSSVIFRNVGNNDTQYAPSDYSVSVPSIYAWSVGDYDGLRLQEEYSYPNS